MLLLPIIACRDSAACDDDGYNSDGARRTGIIDNLAYRPKFRNIARFSTRRRDGLKVEKQEKFYATD
jgi:hypothetical protein